MRLPEDYGKGELLYQEQVDLHVPTPALCINPDLTAVLSLTSCSKTHSLARSATDPQICGPYLHFYFKSYYMYNLKMLHRKHIISLCLISCPRRLAVHHTLHIAITDLGCARWLHTSTTPPPSPHTTTPPPPSLHLQITPPPPPTTLPPPRLSQPSSMLLPIVETNQDIVQLLADLR